MRGDFGAAAVWGVILALSTAGGLRGENAAVPGELDEEMPTLRCLGFRWVVGGDDNRNARVSVEYRAVGTERWKPALDLFRVEPEGMRPTNRPAAGQRLFAGSIFHLTPGTAYEVRLGLADPDGGSMSRMVKTKTWSEPQIPGSLRTIDVQPGQLQAALKKARPGDRLVLHRGVYEGTIQPPSGTPEQPIALVGAGDGEVLLDGRGGHRVIAATGLHDVFFEDLAVRNATWGITVNGGARITVRRCTITECDYGFNATAGAERQSRILLADNVIRGRSVWPRTQGIENRRGVQISGQGHVVCYNRISHFADAIDTFSTPPCAAIDFYGNEISECTDDGIEMDYSEHNTRCFENRLTNVYQGISVQPVYGGPVYIFRNALYNVGLETFKIHNSPSGAVFYHNTSVKAGPPLTLQTSEPASNCVSRNNLFLGTADNYAYENNAPMQRCDFDYDGFGGQWKMFLKWNRVRYATLEEAARKAPVYRHAVRVDPATAFQSGLQPPADVKRQYRPEQSDLRLREGAKAVDAGAVLANVAEGYRGAAPDLGAYELGEALPHYGPRPPKP